MRLLGLLLALSLSVGEISAQSSSGGNTPSNPSAWTIDSLKSHYDQLAAKDAEILALHKEMFLLNDKHSSELRAASDLRYEQRFNAQEAASTYTRTIQNEFRASLNDLSNTKVPRTEFDAALKALNSGIENAAKSATDKLDALIKTNTTAFTEINRRLDIKEGSSTGIWNFVGLLIGLIMVVIAVAGYILSTGRNDHARAS